MSNRLKPVEVSTIRLLWDRGWSRRRIARELGLDRGTVRKYVQSWLSAASADPPEGCESKPANEHWELAAAKPASEHIGTEEQIPAESKPANLHIGLEPKPASEHLPVAGHRSVCQPYAQWIQSKLDQGLSVQRIFQDLCSEQGYTGCYHSVRRYVRRLRPHQALPFRRMEAAPGDEVQVDFGQGAWIVDGQGKKRRPHLFRMVLSHSRKAYSEVVVRQTADAFLQCLENAFHHFGGVTKTVVIDNLKAGVLQADWYDPELNPKLEAFARHYGTVILPTKPRTPRHKGKVERGVDYVQENAVKGMAFASLQEQNQYLRHWEATVADVRIHGTTRQQVQQHFETVERAALLPLPESRFPNYQEGQRKVHRDGHVEVQKSFYSVL